ncbi:hypothetical protein PIB30_011837 [Stylosanthes scabra]|uniref:Uncharacterized protein n=1 Tax=Stylosanthes scabra TaxID=79078 RepID=A0ABU6T6B4_9FABA|nr:hypothetical protein [Stylosanthes scabra]
MKFTLEFLFAMMPFIATPTAVVLAAFIMKIHGRGLFDKNRKYHPISGTVLDHLFNFHRLVDFMTELASQRKTYRMLNFLRHEVYTADPINIEHILVTNFANYGKGWHQYSILSDLLGDGIFVVEGKKWRHQRKTASYQFSTKILRDFSSSVFKTNAVKLAGIVSQAAASNNSIELQVDLGYDHIMFFRGTQYSNLNLCNWQDLLHEIKSRYCI